MKNGLFLSFILLLLCNSCSEGPKKKSSDWTPEQIEKKRLLVKEVMAIHDEAMPWMDNTHALRKELSAANENAEIDSIKIELQRSIAFLDSADEAMMVWMRGYKEPQDTGSFDEAMKYLRNQKQSASVMRNTMAASIEQAKRFTQ